MGIICPSFLRIISPSSVVPSVGVIGSQDSGCPGFAPDVELYTFKVFTDDQV